MSSLVCQPRESPRAPGVESWVFPPQSDSDRSYALPDLSFPIRKLRSVTGSHCMALPWKQKEVMLVQNMLGEGWFFHPSLQAERLNILQVCVRPGTAIHL